MKCPNNPKKECWEDTNGICYYCGKYMLEEKYTYRPAKRLVRLKYKERDFEDVIRMIDININELNKKENYSLRGEKKSCCQAELMGLKRELKTIKQKQKDVKS